MLLSQLGRDDFRGILCAALLGFMLSAPLPPRSTGGPGGVEPIGVQLKTVHYVIK